MLKVKISLDKGNSAERLRLATAGGTRSEKPGRKKEGRAEGVAIKLRKAARAGGRGAWGLSEGEWRRGVDKAH